jgi:8-oxo-dGTP pyrophosphatase MutT (NUDIX family)
VQEDDQKVRRTAFTGATLRPVTGQPTTTAANGRVFACSPAAVLGMIVDDDERFLLLEHPTEPGWQIVNGGLEADETVLDGARREVREEAGPWLRVRPLGVVHVCTWRYDDGVTHMIDVTYLFHATGGHVVPGDDMAGSAVRWASLEEIESGAVRVTIPEETWMFRRGLQLFRLWRDEEPVTLQQ